MIKIIITIVVILIISVVGIGLLFSSKEIESYLSNYPHTLQALIALFTFLTSTLSIGVAYATYSKNIKQQKKVEDEKQRQFQENSNRLIENIRDELRNDTRKLTEFILIVDMYNLDLNKAIIESDIITILSKMEENILKEKKEHTTLLTGNDINYMNNLYQLCGNSRSMIDIYTNTYVKSTKEENISFQRKIVDELIELRETIFNNNLP
ncbi:hypothetical protein HYE69_02690 [Staphylococcus sp. GSSP0090]|nr:hypothetical protein [Staphylococcus sp. GSSP0090]